MAAART